MYIFHRDGHVSRFSLLPPKECAAKLFVMGDWLQCSKVGWYLEKLEARFYILLYLSPSCIPGIISGLGLKIIEEKVLPLHLHKLSTNAKTHNYLCSRSYLMSFYTVNSCLADTLLLRTGVSTSGENYIGFNWNSSRYYKLPPLRYYGRILGSLSKVIRRCHLLNQIGVNCVDKITFHWRCNELWNSFLHL